MLLGTGCKLITVSTHGKWSGSGGNCVATAAVEAIVAEPVDCVMVGAVAVGEFASGASIGNIALGLVPVGW